MTNCDRVSPHRRRKKVPSRSRRQLKPARGSKGYLLLPVVLVIAVVAAVAFLMNRESAVDIRTAETAAEADAARYVAEAGLRHALWKADAGACSGYGLPATSFGGHGYQAVFAPDSGSPVSVTSTGTLASGASRSIRRDGIRIGEAPTTFILQPDAAAGTDTYLYASNPNTSFGTAIEIRISNKTNNNKRGLLRFDLGSINTTAIVESAELELNLEGIGSGGTHTIYVHRAQKPWIEDEATWNQYANGLNWDTPGGDYEIPEIAGSPIDAALPGATTFDVTDLVQDWINEPATNNGIMLLGSSGVNHADFTTSDSTNAGLRPKLTVAYACECGQVCTPPTPSCEADFTPNASVAEFSTAGQSYRYNRGVTYFPQGQSINGTPAPPGGGWITVGNSGRLVLLDLDGNILDDGFDTGLDSLQGVAFVSAGLKAGQLAIVKGNTLYFADPTVTPASASYTTHVLPFVSAAGGVTHIDGGTYDGHLAVADTGSGVIHIFDQSLNLVTTLNTAAILDAPEGIAHLRDTDKFLLVDKNLNRAFVIHADLTVSQNYDLIPYGWGEASAAALHPTSCDHLFADHANNRYKSLNALSGTIDVRVASSSDDAEELMTTNDVDLVGNDLQLVEDLGVTQMVGLRFDNLNVPNGAPITGAWIQFQTAATNMGASNLTLNGEAADDAAAFAAAAANISSRTLTTASAAWSPGDWPTIGEAGPEQRTPDIASLIQEIVDRPGWTPGNALVVFISGSNTRTAESFDGDPAGAPLLHIEF